MQVAQNAQAVRAAAQCVTHRSVQSPQHRGGDHKIAQVIRQMRQHFRRKIIEQTLQGIRHISQHFLQRASGTAFQALPHHLQRNHPAFGFLRQQPGLLSRNRMAQVAAKE